jgi:hypothetical protein
MGMRGLRGVTLVLAAIAMLAAIGGSSVAPRAQAQEGVNVLSDAVRNDFPTGVTFTLSFSSAEQPDEVRVSYELAPDGTGATAIADCDGSGTINCSFTLTSGRGIYVIPGAQITYHWEVTDAAGDRTSTEEQLYVHGDTRFSFSELREGNVTVFYHPGTADEAPAVLQAAIEGIDRTGRLEQATVPFPVKIFLYETAQEMQPAIVSGGGQGVTVLGEVLYSDTAMVSADTATLDITRHEIAHIVTREATRGPFDIPGWLNEGISVFVQNEPLPGHASALDAAIAGDRVLTMPELNSSATGSSGSTVGVYYGQAGSMVRYLVETYGEEQFAELLRTFREGSRIDNAFETVYGFNQAGLENEWREYVGLPPRVAAPTATPDPEEARGEATSAAGDGEGSASSSGDGDDGGVNVSAWGIIGVLAVAVAGTGVFSARVIRSRL